MIVRLHVVTDLVLAGIFAVLAVWLGYVAVKSRGLPSAWAFAAVGIFSAACASLHLSQVLTGWSPTSWVSGAFKLLMALAAIGTAALLLRVVPKTLAIARARDLLQHNLDSRQQDIEKLVREVIARRCELEASARALRVARDDAEQASRIKSDFLSLVSHEIRTPMMKLRLESERLRRLAEASAAARDLMDKAGDAASQLVSHVSDLLEFADLQSGRIRPRLERVDLDAIVRRVTGNLAASARVKHLELRYEPRPEVREVVTDWHLIGLVVEHLVSNAIEHTDRGSVQVSLRVADHEAMHVIVSDTGPGIPPEWRDAIFEPFVATEPVASKHKPGIGLGLAIVRHALAALGGRLELVSTSGIGSTFTVVLPSEPRADHGAPG